MAHLKGSQLLSSSCLLLSWPISQFCQNFWIFKRNCKTGFPCEIFLFLSIVSNFKIKTKQKIPARTKMIQSASLQTITLALEMVGSSD